jgi:riboflavin kinase/FMN adenylyltransferase
VGVFDGVHLGHQAVIEKAVEDAAATGTVPAVLTFDPHPDTVLCPRSAPALLTTRGEKLSLLRGLGVGLTVIASFDTALAETPPEVFVGEVLVGKLRAQTVVVGEDWRFGAQGAGSPALLDEMASELGYRVSVVAAAVTGGAKVSSTRIRALVARGRVRAAAGMLGRPYGASGFVVRGDGIGTQLGYPTANLAVDREKLVPAAGVYACLAGQRRLHPAIGYIGARPTLGADQRQRLEVHLLERRGRIDLVGRRLAVQFIRRLRGERLFGSRSALAKQIGRDCRRARRVLEALHEQPDVLPSR